MREAKREERRGTDREGKREKDAAQWVRGGFEGWREQCVQGIRQRGEQDCTGQERTQSGEQSGSDRSRSEESNARRGARVVRTVSSGTWCVQCRGSERGETPAERGSERERKRESRREAPAAREKETRERVGSIGRNEDRSERGSVCGDTGIE